MEFILGTLWMKAGEGTVLEMFDTESIVRDNAVRVGSFFSCLLCLKVV